MNELNDILEELAAHIIMASHEDMAELASAHTEFKTIVDMCDTFELSEAKVIAESAGALVEQLIMSEVDDPDAAMEQLHGLIVNLQGIIRDGRTHTPPPPARDLPDDEGDSAPVQSETHVTPVSSVPVPAAIPENETPTSVQPIEIEKIRTSFLDDPGLVADFIAESWEHLEASDNYLLELEANLNDTEALNAVFRAFHTIKGVSGFLELHNIKMLAHQTENMLDLMRQDDIPVTPSSIDLTFEAVDHLKQMLDALVDAVAARRAPEIPETLAALIPRIQKEQDTLQGKTPESSAPPPSSSLPKGPVTAAAASPASSKANYMFTMEPIKEAESTTLFIPAVRERLDANDQALLVLEKNPSSPENIDELFRNFHTIKGEASFLELPQIHRLAHALESILENFRDKPDEKIPGAYIDLFFEAGDVLKRMVENLDAALNGDKLIPAPPEEFFSIMDRLDSDTVGRQAKAPIADSDDGGEQKQDAIKKAPATKKMGREPLKVDALRLDLLIDTIGELVIAEAMVSQSEELASHRSTALRSYLNHLNKITRELQQIGMGLRMVTVRNTFNKMARVVRDITKKRGKKVDFVTEGEDTELDKTVVDLIGDPLLHMVRNAVDHGIESIEGRIAAGKPETGTVKLCAYHKEGNIVIDVTDDGSGLRKDTILAKAVERGVISKDEAGQLDDRQIFALVMAPGFSTAEAVTDISGRGVGMDVVKQNITNLRGTIEISSEEGNGSVFTIKVPLTLAIIDGMLVKVGAERYVIPTLSIIRSVQPGEGDISTVLGKGEMMNNNGKLIPIFRLSNIFQVAAAETDLNKALIVVVESDGLQAGIVTDTLLGQQQIVIKSLGESLQGIKGISGGAILTDGKIGLIIDTGGLVKLAHEIADEEPIAETGMPPTAIHIEENESYDD